jgi:trimethylamine---corrinoid protein Co-methyltransferase
MPLKGFIRSIKPYEILTKEQEEMIHTSTLSVLENTGIRFESKKALKIFKKNGCNVDSSNNRVRFPSSIVEECLRKCPSGFTVRSRNPRCSVRLGGNTLYFSNMPGKGILDITSGRIRPATKEENINSITVLDSLENLHVLSCYTPYFEVEGIEPVMAIPESVAANMRHSTKVQWTGYQKDCEQFCIEMAKVTDQDIMGVSCSSTPLTYNSDACESAIRFVEAGFPIDFVSGCIMGGTSPATIAGSLVLFDSEVIGGIVLAQLVKPGSKVVVENGMLPMNMRYGIPIFGSIASSLHIAAFGQIWRHYCLPIFAGCGWTNSKDIDFQDGYERSISAVIIALCGYNVALLHGGVYGELAFHPLQAILDDDIAGMIGRFMEGIIVSDETIATDLIAEVGPIPGHFLNTEHTRKYFRNENYFPKVADMLPYYVWENEGKKGALKNAEEKMIEILKTHKVEPLPEDQDREIEKILRKARNYYEIR